MTAAASTAVSISGLLTNTTRFVTQAEWAPLTPTWARKHVKACNIFHLAVLPEGSEGVCCLSVVVVGAVVAVVVSFLLVDGFSQKIPS